MAGNDVEDMDSEENVQGCKRQHSYSDPGFVTVRRWQRMNPVPNQEKMRGQRGRLPVQPLGYVMSTKVIFRRVEVFVLAEVCLPRRPHAGQHRSDV